jgi:hypothetical protein
MQLSIIRAVSTGAIGGIAAFLAFGPAAPHGAQLSALLIGWAAYHQFGGKLAGLKQSVIHLALGAAAAALALLLATRLPLDETLGSGASIALAVAITLAALALAPKLPGFSDIPVLLLGYAALFAAAAIGGADKIVALAPDNPFVTTIVSLAVGAVLGLLSDILVDTLQKYLPLGRSQKQSATSA